MKERDAILSQLRERIVAYATSRLSREGAEDLAQDVLIVIHEKYPDAEGLVELVPLAFQILRFKLLEAHRKAVRRGEYNRAPLEADAVEDPGDNPETDVDRRRRAARLFGAIQQMPARCRQLFLWKLEGKRFTEIRALLGADSINTVYTWDFRCRKRLLELMGGSWES